MTEPTNDKTPTGRQPAGAKQKTTSTMGGYHNSLNGQPQHGDVKRHLVERYDADRNKWVLCKFVPGEV